MSYNLCFIDFETTGLNLHKDHPIELGACLYDVMEGRITHTYESRVAVPKEAVMDKVSERIHGVSIEEARLGKDPAEVLFDFFNIMGTNYSLAGWNVQFDVTVLRDMCHKYGFSEEFDKIHYRHLDVQSFLRGLCDAGFYDRPIGSLNDAVKLCRFGRKEHHSAMEDAILACKVYGRVKKAVWSDLVCKFA